MNDDPHTESLARNDILKLLSDQEVANVSTAETEPLASGEPYLDLEHLFQGVQYARGVASPSGRVLPKKAVHEETWIKILAQLALSPEVPQASVAFDPSAPTRAGT